MSIDWDSLVLAPLHAAFGEAIAYQSQVIGPFTLSDAVLDRAYVEVGTDAGGIPVNGWRTICGIRMASCPSGFEPQDGDLITARGSTWQVVDEQPDGKGNVLLVLAATQ